MTADRRVLVCVKHAPRRVAIDPLTGDAWVDEHDIGLSAADEAAVEVALTHGTQVTALTVGGDAAETSLRAVAAVGVDRLVRVRAGAEPTSAGVAAGIAAACAELELDPDLIVCGDYSADRGSGSVPAFLAAALGAAQALGVVAVQAGADGLEVQRRLDRGRREVLRVPNPAVVSVEGSVARLRRASLAGLRAADAAAVEVVGAVPAGAPQTLHPHRPRVQPRPAPSPELRPFERIQLVTQATSSRTPPRRLELEPADAADTIVAQLRTWGYLAEDT